MNLPSESRTDDDFTHVEDEGTGNDAEALESTASFAGDTGVLPVPARRVFVRLLQGPSIDARRHEKLWDLLKRYERDLRSRLHELFLELVVDNESRVAFTKQVVSDELDVPILLRKQSLSFLESVLLLFLRQRLTHSEAQAERAVVDELEISEYLRAYERDDNGDSARFGRQIEGCIEKAKKLGVLLRLPGGDDRYEISGTLRLLFPVDEVLALSTAYQLLKPALLPDPSEPVEGSQ